MPEEKYSLPFINDGEEFEMPIWTMDKQEKVDAIMTKYEDTFDVGTRPYNKRLNIEIILLSLKEVDKSIVEKDLNSLHPADFVELSNACFTSGRHGIHKEDFHEGDKNPLF